jgi:pyruvate,water dikinase
MEIRRNLKVVVDYQYAQYLEGHGSVATAVGGKASSLDRLVADGFPVPRAAVISVRAYQAFVREAGLEPFLKDLQHGPLPPVDQIAADRSRVESEFMRPPLSPQLEDEILHLIGDFLSNGPIAVRSSATAEDMVTASFAGQYETFLGIKTRQEALIAVRRCWASLWSPQVRVYRRREHIAEDDLAMAVIVQAMADASWAGVLFTRDPQGSALDIKVEAVPGLGDDLVAGRVTPHSFVISRATLAIRSRGERARLDFLEDLARLGLRIENHAGAPQDIEWAMTHDGLRVLQARPITVSRPLALHDDGFDTRRNESDEYTPRGVSEMLPGVVSPLLWSINAPMLEDAFRSLFSSIGAAEVGAGRRIVSRFRGRATLNLSVLREVAASLPGGSSEEVERQYLGHVLEHDDPLRAARSGAIARVTAAFRSWRTNRLLADEVGLIKHAVHGIVQLDVDLSRLPAERLLRYRNRIRDLAWRIYATEVAASSAAAASYRALEVQVGRWLGREEGVRWAQRLTAGTLAESSVGAGRVNRLRDIYRRHVAGTPALQTSLMRSSPHPRERIEALGARGVSFLDEVDQCVRAFGGQAVYAGRTWNEDMVGVWSQLAAFARTGERTSEPTQDSLGELISMLKRSPRWRFKRIITGQLIDMRLRMLRRMVEEATLFLRCREEAKSSLLVLGGAERRVIFEIADRLVASGHLSSASNVELFADGELEQMLHGAEPVFRQEIERRMRAFNRAKDAGPLPEVFHGDPDAVEHTVAAAGPVMQGWAASPGTARGRARVLTSLEAGTALEPGEIIVAHSTDPSWTPLFLIAGGIILEEGGPLSHAAIVAREFGLPAVLNVADAVQSIATGEDLVVDGTTGEVQRVALAERTEGADGA